MLASELGLPETQLVERRVLGGHADIAPDVGRLGDNVESGDLRARPRWSILRSRRSDGHPNLCGAVAFPLRGVPVGSAVLDFNSIGGMVPGAAN